MGTIHPMLKLTQFSLQKTLSCYSVLLDKNPTFFSEDRFYGAIRGYSQEILKEMLPLAQSAKIDINTLANKKRSHPLIWAMAFGYLPTVKVLVEKYKANVNFEQYLNHWTPAAFAALFGYNSILEYLAENGALLDKRYYGQTAREPDPDSKKYPGDTLLHMACKTEWNEFVFCLGPITWNGSNRPAMIDYLVNEKKFNVNALGRFNKIPLHHACGFKGKFGPVNEWMINYLLSKKSDTKHEDIFGKKPLDYVKLGDPARTKIEGLFKIYAKE